MQKYSESNMDDNNNEKDEFQEFYNSNLIIEEQVDDLNALSPPFLQYQADAEKIVQILEEDSKKKNEFMATEESNEYIQILVVSQLRMNFTNDDPFMIHIYNVVEGIKKAVRNIMTFNKLVENDQAFDEQQESILKLFFQDINIGFITSTGAIKSTAFLFLQKQYASYINNKKINIQFEQIQMNMALKFFNLQDITPIKSQPITDFRNSFIRNKKFESEFLVLQELSGDEVKSGVTIYFVYTPIDDQIYAIKRVSDYEQYPQQSRLQSKTLNQSDVFNSVEVQGNSDLQRISEAKILSKLTHPNVLKLFDWWIEYDGECYYLYMQLEYCSFPGYRQQCQNLLLFSYCYMNAMPTMQKLKLIKTIMLQIVDGLEYIHQKGILHRDLKLENVFVTIDILGDLQVMLADFDYGKDVLEENLKAKDQLLSLDDMESKEGEFHAMGVMMLHLVLAFPGEPRYRNKYVKEFMMKDPDDILNDFDHQAMKQVKNRNPDFSFVNYRQILYLAKKLINRKINDHSTLRKAIEDL